ncbi:hypothetical protein SAY86_024441 [Trapa natans]|uniref:RRP12-like protein n=1 Tax=Trapa natans TaxID=22666 RepID=A0AAN7M545_TRANT|nr:hypothetical protein SAY86_024441 [Trapa natans]
MTAKSVKIRGVATMTPPRKRARDEGMPVEQEERPEEPLKDGSDICQQLMDRYAKSSAPQHRHLIATAAATRSILSAESLPLIPSSYFAAAMANLERASSSPKTLSSTEIAALMSFLVIIIPAIPPRGIALPKAREAVEVLVKLVIRQGGEDSLGVSTVRSAVKCLGILLGFCDVEDWDSVSLAFETLLRFSVDKRPKVRRCAQECLQNALHFFQSPAVAEKASTLIFSSLKDYIPSAVKLSSSPVSDVSENQMEPVEVLRIFNVVRLTLPSISPEVRMKILLELRKLLSSHFSVLTTHIHKIIEAFLENLKVGDATEVTEGIIVSLSSYVSSIINPMDTVISAAKLAKVAMDKLQIEGSEARMRNLPIVCCSLAGHLASESETASGASGIFKELINCHIDEKILSIAGQLSEGEDESTLRMEARAIQTICASLENILKSCKGTPTKHFLEIVSTLFLKLGGCSFSYMKKILLKLAELMMHGNRDAPDTEHLQRCMGSAVISIGPEKMLNLFPISVHPDDFSYTNFWLVPILKDYIIGSSLNYYMEHIVPLAKTFQQASHKVGKSLLGKDLKRRAHDLWKLLTAFCRHPGDTHKQFPRLAKLLAVSMKKYSFMQESAALALKVLVSENRCILGLEKDDLDYSPLFKDFMEVFQNLQPYSIKTATRNIKALASFSVELLQIFSDLFINSVPGKRSHLKDAISCLACIVNSSVTKEIFYSLLENFGSVQSRGDNPDSTLDDMQRNMSPSTNDVKRCVMMELASCLVKGANQDLIESIFNFTKQTFQEPNDTCHAEAYHVLSRILEEHDWFCSSHYAELLDVLLSLKTPTDIAILSGRFACFHVLMVYTLKMNLEEENNKAFLILNEIILISKDAEEEARKAAYDILLAISSSLRSRFSDVAETLYKKLINMIMGYLSTSSSPQISSGAVSALSVLLYNDTNVCLSVEDLVPSLLSLLQSKAVEVIKAVLGFVKVLVSCMPTKDLQNLLNDIIDGIIPWSSVSRHHFRSKVTVILEILIRKCGLAAIDSVIPGKYKGFLKTVTENRRGKSSDGPNTGDTDTIADLDTTGNGKRKHDKLGQWPEGDASAESKRRKGEGKANGPNPSVGHEAMSEGFRKGRGNKPFKAHQRKETKRRGNRNFGGAANRQNRNGKPRDMGKKAEGNKKSFAGSRLHKPKKFDRNRQKK